MVWTVNNQCTFIELGCPLQAESGNRHVIHYTTPERQAPPPAYYYAHIKPCISVPASVSVCVRGGGWMYIPSVCVCSPRSSAVVVVRGAGSPPPATSPEEQAERAAGKGPHAAQHEQHEARAHSQVSGVSGTSPVHWWKKLRFVVGSWCISEVSQA